MLFDQLLMNVHTTSSLETRCADWRPPNQAASMHTPFLPHKELSLSLGLCGQGPSPQLPPRPAPDSQLALPQPRDSSCHQQLHLGGESSPPRCCSQRLQSQPTWQEVSHSCDAKGTVPGTSLVCALQYGSHCLHVAIYIKLIEMQSD